MNDRDTGFLVEPGDIDELRDRLALLLADPSFAEEMGRRGRDVVVAPLHLGTLRRAVPERLPRATGKRLR